MRASLSLQTACREHGHAYAIDDTADKIKVSWKTYTNRRSSFLQHKCSSRNDLVTVRQVAPLLQSFKRSTIDGSPFRRPDLDQRIYIVTPKTIYSLW